MPTLCHHPDENLESIILGFYRDDHSLRLAGAERGGKRLELFASAEHERNGEGAPTTRPTVLGVFYFRQNRDWSELLIFLFNNQTVC